MKNYKLIILSALLGLSFSSFASNNSNDEAEAKEYTKAELNAIINQSIRLLNYETREKELITEPLSLKKDEVIKYLPPLKESPIIYDMYIEAGFNVVDAIRYTHMDILDLYKDHVDKEHVDKENKD